MHNQAISNEWWDIAAKAATSLLRYIGTINIGAAPSSIVPADKAFYLAGNAWKRIADRRGQAFVFLNAFLDTTEAIEDGNTASLDLSDLLDTGIPLTFELPQREAMYVDDDGVEAAKDWVLEISMHQDIDQSLAV